MRARTSLVAVLLFAATSAAAQSNAARITEWRRAHERDIARELMELVAIPNVATNDADMRRNAERLTAMFRKRGFEVETTTEAKGAPVVLATLTVPDALGVLTFYIHYDGQAVTPSQWTHCPPFEPCLVSRQGKVSLEGAGPLDPETRMYGRSTSDDKGPIVAILNAVDAVKAVGGGPRWSLRVVLDGQEEAGSANFDRFVETSPDKLRGDLALTLDGPRHPSGVPTMYFGARAGAGVTVTVYGAAMDLHSGNYGNWAPDPSFRLARLLASMKDETGRVLIEGFYDDVTPLTEEERRALAEAPNVEQELKRAFGVAVPELPDERIEVKYNRPTLSVQNLEAGGGFSTQARTVVPGSSSARLAIRMVAGLDPERQNERVIAHIRKQGYFVVINRDPTMDERRAHALLARVDRRGGARASRSSMAHPLARAVIAALTRDGVPPVRLPTLGGSLPFGSFSDVLGMPTVGISLVNFDNNQHGPDENLRLQNLWDGVELLASVMAMPRPSSGSR
jgi:acetylornithine deacetylase/succinyl-diaminopimelate desuccinylase-like protein